ncbi:MAG: hypothetical protein DLM72_01690 [Candidatus Nitrosopolaris wilkensis]|nr:MAG: hypothetical protein DLM72_01690 [Candidatus Nitrosopolaris wilkensis]
MQIKTNTKCLNILDELGYLPITSKVDEILYDSVEKAFKIIGKVAYNALLDRACSIHGLSERELLTNYDLFEKSLYDIFGKVSFILLRALKKEILIHAVIMNSRLTVSDISNPSTTIDDILEHIREVEVFEFVRKILSHEHILFLYENKKSNDNILSEFFIISGNDNAPKGLLSVIPADNLNLISSNVLYDELGLRVQNKHEALEKLSDWMVNLHSSNKSDFATRIAFEDGTWWLRNGLADDYIRFEESLGKHIQNNLSILCGYDISSFNELYIEAIIASHIYVILGEPMIIYKASK